MAQNINRVVLTGNLTRDPQLHTLASGTAVCNVRIATNTSRKVNDEWQDKPNYFDVIIFNGQAKAAAKYLRTGRKVAIDGRLEWREYETDEGSRRQKVEIVASAIEFLGRPPEDDGDSAQDVEPATDSEAAAEEIPF